MLFLAFSVAFLEYATTILGIYTEWILIFSLVPFAVLWLWRRDTVYEYVYTLYSIFFLFELGFQLTLMFYGREFFEFLFTITIGKSLEGGASGLLANLDNAILTGEELLITPLVAILIFGYDRYGQKLMKFYQNSPE